MRCALGPHVARVYRRPVPVCARCKAKGVTLVSVYWSARVDLDLCRPCWFSLVRIVRRFLKSAPATRGKRPGKSYAV